MTRQVRCIKNRIVRERKCRPQRVVVRIGRQRWARPTDNSIPSSAPFPFRGIARGGIVAKVVHHCDKERNPMRVPDKWLMPLARGRMFPRPWVENDEGS